MLKKSDFLQDQPVTETPPFLLFPFFITFKDILFIYYSNQVSVRYHRSFRSNEDRTHAYTQ